MANTQENAVPPPRLLLVEGNDKFFIEQLNMKYGIPESAFTVDKKGSVDDVLEAFELHLDFPETEKLGILVDADTDVGERWNAIKCILGKAGYGNLPETPSPTGTVVRQSGKPDVGCWIMPDNKAPGALEDFVRFLVPADDNLWPLSESTVDGIATELRRFKEQHRLKVVLHTWLAWQKEPGTPIGMAVQRKYLDASAAPAQVLVAWLRNLFGIESPP